MTDDTFLRSEEYDYDSSDSDFNYGEVSLPESEDIVDLVENGEKAFNINITYSFPAKRRRTKFGKGSYGKKYMTFRRLYDLLCEVFNDGERFIDTYIDEVYTISMYYTVEERLRDFKNFVVKLADQIMIDNVRLTKKGEFDRRVNAKKILEEKGYFEYKKEQEQKICADLAEEIKNDIEYSLANGIIRLNHINKPKTFEVREKLGLDSEHVFYASKQLIRSIKVFFDMGASGKWKTAHPNIMV